jgi:hypothetical protein
MLPAMSGQATAMIER